MRTLRCRNVNEPGTLGELTSTIGSLGASIGDIRTLHWGRLYVTRDIDVVCENESHLKLVVEKISKLKNSKLEEVIDEVLMAHERGKIEMHSTHPVRTIRDLRNVYTPGVANVCRAILENPEVAYLYTAIPRMVAIVTDGTRVLGLGNIGPVASMPVMEGKAALLHQLAGLSGVPILINTTNVDKIVEAVSLIAPTFGAIQLEDISTPRCFEIEERLIEKLDIPVMHDDQHGTAVVTLAAIINACKLVKKDLGKLCIGQIGLGAAGQAIASLLKQFTGNSVLGTDINREAIRRFERKGGIPSTYEEIMDNVEIVIATTGVADLIKSEHVKKGQIILALSNPFPEIQPEEAVKHGATFAADGKSVNNILGFPGILKGALDCQARKINYEMYIAAALCLAEQAEREDLVPTPLNLEVHKKVARVVAEAAIKTGVARRELDRDYFDS